MLANNSPTARPSIVTAVSTGGLAPRRPFGRTGLSLPYGTIQRPGSASPVRFDVPAAHYLASRVYDREAAVESAAVRVYVIRGMSITTCPPCSTCPSPMITWNVLDDAPCT